MNYLDLAALGDQLLLNFYIEPIPFIDWTEKEFKYVPYNPRKKNNRFGLSLTSLDGKTSGIPDLDSLPEYNQENKTNYHEKDFNVPTPVFNYSELKKIFHPVLNHVYRSHIIKLGPGGFFPTHRDLYPGNFTSFRIIAPLVETCPTGVKFILDSKTLNWIDGRFYFINTAKEHSLFNASYEYSYWLIINMKLSNTSISWISNNLSVT